MKWNLYSCLQNLLCQCTRAWHIFYNFHQKRKFSAMVQAGIVFAEYFQVLNSYLFARITTNLKLHIHKWKKTLVQNHSQTLTELRLKIVFIHWYTIITMIYTWISVNIDQGCSLLVDENRLLTVDLNSPNSTTLRVTESKLKFFPPAAQILCYRIIIFLFQVNYSL